METCLAAADLETVLFVAPLAGASFVFVGAVVAFYYAAEPIDVVAAAAAAVAIGGVDTVPL